MSNKDVIIDSNMTIKELNILFLESRYETLTYNSYTNYNSSIKKINEYYGDVKIKDFSIDSLTDFEEYLRYRRKWKYTKGTGPSDVTIHDIIQVFKIILNQARMWGLFDEKYNCIVEERINEKDRKRLDVINNSIIEIKKRNAFDKLDELLTEKRPS